MDDLHSRIITGELINPESGEVHKEARIKMKKIIITFNSLEAEIEYFDDNV